MRSWAGGGVEVAAGVFAGGIVVVDGEEAGVAGEEGEVGEGEASLGGKIGGQFGCSSLTTNPSACQAERLLQHDQAFEGCSYAHISRMYF